MAAQSGTTFMAFGQSDGGQRRERRHHAWPGSSRTAPIALVGGTIQARRPYKPNIVMAGSIHTLRMLWKEKPSLKYLPLQQVGGRGRRDNVTGAGSGSQGRHPRRSARRRFENGFRLLRLPPGRCIALVIESGGLVRSTYANSWHGRIDQSESSRRLCRGSRTPRPRALPQ